MAAHTKYCIVICGPTATGKTETAISLAQHFDTEILSADARQFYREMHIGTAKPTQAQLQKVKHHFIDHISIHNPWDAGTFAHEALSLLSNIFIKKDVAILCGGSGLFIKALTEGFDIIPDVSEEIRNKVKSMYLENGLPFLQRMLEEKDPEYYKTVDRQNPHRLMRALEVCLQTYKPYSYFRKQEPEERPFRSIYICLDIPREKLYGIIDARVDAMIADGLVEEARALLPFRKEIALQTVGYSELFEHFDGNCDLNTAIEKIKQHTRNYAKRQMTWFRSAGYRIFDPKDISSILQYIEEDMSH
ncbi:MAG: tRNA (adenosine(37)-N6)-dimethylallyltransferase MiaA [Chitinophagales bacterium]